MRPFDESRFDERDDSDVALMVAAVREWPAEAFARELDARVQRRFAPEVPDGSGGRGRVRLPRWAAGPAVALAAGAAAAVIVVSGGGGNGGLVLAGRPLRTVGGALYQGIKAAPYRGAVHAGPSSPVRGLPAPAPALGAPTGAAQGTLTTYGSATSASGSANAVAGGAAPVAPGARQIQSAQISLTTRNAHVDQVAQEVFNVVGQEHGTVLSSRITAAASGAGGGYAFFSLSVPTGNLQTVMTDLSRLPFAAVASRTDASQNVSHQYDGDQRRLADARALRTSLLKQLQTAYTQAAIDSLKAQLRLAEQQIAYWEATLGALQHQISHSDVSVQINENGLPILTAPPHHASGFTLGRAGHDALRVLVVSAGVALIALAVLVPVGLVAALLMWLWVWLRQRRREHALDAAG